MVKDKFYWRRHRRVVRHRGRARNYACADCGGQAREWATIHGRDGESPDDYRPLCNRCHFWYDGKTLQRRGEQSSNGRLTNEQVLAIWARRAEGPTALAPGFGVSPQCIS